MNVKELKKYMENLNYDTGIVSFNEGEKIGGFNIQNFSSIWRFYFIDDKGHEGREFRFFTEEELCSFVLKFVEDEHIKLLNRRKKITEKKDIVTPKVIEL